MINSLKKGLPAGSRGFTLIEMLLYMGIISVFLMVLTSILISVLDTQLTSNSSSAVDQSGQYLLVRLQYDIRRANSIITPANIGNSSNSLSLSIGGVTYSYSVNSGVLVLTTGLKTYNLSPYDVQISNFTATRLGNVGGRNSIQIGFTITSTTVSTTQKSQVRNYQTTIDLR
jgi:prepilin-type N-terminal cleavage/methylation domain-containing protein